MAKEYSIARMNINNENYEILVKSELAYKYSQKKQISLSKILITDDIFKDSKKGLKASENDLKKAFGTLDILIIADRILKKGNLQLTAVQRRRMVEEKRKQIIDFISKQSINPKTNLPHPPVRIEQALETIHFSVDPYKKIEEQSKEAIKNLRTILPISIEKMSVSVKIPPEYAGRSYGTIKSFGTLKNESWGNDGSLLIIIELPAGLYGPFLEKLGEITRGNIETKRLN